MSTQRYVSITSCPTVMQKQHVMAVNFWGCDVRGWGAPTEDLHQGNTEPFFIFTSVLGHCMPSLPSVKKINKKIKKYIHVKSCRLYEIHFGLSYSNELQQQLLRPLTDLVQNWLFHIIGPCSLSSHRAGMLDSMVATKATNSGFIHFDLSLPSTVSISFELWEGLKGGIFLFSLPTCFSPPTLFPPSPSSCPSFSFYSDTYSLLILSLSLSPPCVFILCSSFNLHKCRINRVSRLKKIVFYIGYKVQLQIVWVSMKDGSKEASFMARAYRGEKEETEKGEGKKD